MDSSKQKQVNLSFRELKIMYLVDGHSIQKMADHFSIDWQDMKQALRDYGFTIRSGEQKPTEPTKSYIINLLDSDKIVKKEEKEVKNNVVVS